MRRINSIIDLEIGEKSIEDLKVKGLGPTPIAERDKRKLDWFRKTGSLNSIGMMRICDELSLSGDIHPSSSSEKLEILVGEGVERAENSIENRKVKDKRKKKFAKPPKPPRAPLLDMADMKFLREMAELARLKHARIQRVKALKKKRADKASSSLSSNILPMIITIVFLFVIFFQGLLSSRA